MRSISFLVAGLITGFILNQVLTKENKPTPSISAVQIAAEPPSTPQSSPFSTLESITSGDKITTSSTESQTQVKANSPDEPVPSIQKIKHYTELTTVLNYIDSANSHQLSGLADELQINEIGQVDYFKHTINAAIFQRWAAVDIDSALSHIIENFDSSVSSQLLLEGVSTLASAQPEYVHEWLTGLNRKQQIMLKHQVYFGMTSKDPEAFARKALKENDDDKSILFSAAMQWSESDPEAAWLFMKNEVDPDISESISSSLLYAWLERDPEGVLSEIELLLENSDESNPEKTTLEEMYATALAHIDPNAALDWITSLVEQNIPGESLFDTQDFQYNTLPSVLYTVTQSDPRAVELWLDQLTVNQKELVLPLALPALTEFLSETDPLRALALAEQYTTESSPGFDNRDMIVQQWLYTDKTAALDWLNELPMNPSSANLIYQSAMSIFHDDPEVALQLIDNIQGSISTDIAISVMATLSATDPAIARQWLNGQTNPEVIHTGNILIDISQKAASTSELLSRIENAASPGNTMMLVMQLLNYSNPQEREAILQWMSTSNALNRDERLQLQSIFQSSPTMGSSAGFYIRHDLNRHDRY